MQAVATNSTTNVVTGVTPWACQPWAKVVGAFRYDTTTHHVECFSNDGVDCLFVSSLATCRSNIAADNGTVVAPPLRPVRCPNTTNETSAPRWCKAIRAVYMGHRNDTPPRKPTREIVHLPKETKSQHQQSMLLTAASILLGVGAIAVVIWIVRKKLTSSQQRPREAPLKAVASAPYHKNESI
ncbi:Aste57867_11819 [Aphanomyces stellatus]|uniref:Aste57867_11819 protein n=1 Tax=Aphanomyces stellatus TaxID=120398 RepID=A0A485KU20_9STRA|nr:hypothetical protein As57867_011774 [Aphanomyces stellatus]VFT88674.1 Aste57867_11819 [Aphanomyces stellatus]